MPGGRVLAFVGCLNRAAPYFGPPRGRGIAVMSFDEESGALAPLSETEGIDNPTFLVVAADSRTLYATSEVYGWREGLATAFAIGPDGSLTYINTQPTLGSIAAQAIQDPSGRWLLVANYRIGEAGRRPPRSVAVFPIAADGGLGPAAHAVTHAGSGPDPARQEGPHPHCVLSSADGSRMLVADLGIDRLVGYRFDRATGSLTPDGELAMPAGRGPRHLAQVGPGIAAVSGELDNTATLVAWDSGERRIVASASTLPSGYRGESHAADIHAAPDGRFVYVSNRGHDSIAVLAIDASEGLAPVAHCPTGKTPRSFTLDPSGLFVLVACQDGHEVTVFRRDAATGLLSGPVARAAIGSPMCVRLARVPDVA